MTTIDDVKRINLKYIEDYDGKLTPIEFHKDVPFEVKRMFYVFGVHNQNDRGKHSHYKTKQLLISIAGSITVRCDDGLGFASSHILDKPWKALYIPEMIWDEQIYTSPDSVLLSICSTEYNKDDYINSYSQFQTLVKD